MADERLIVALDVSTMEDVKSIVESLGDSVVYYKVGMELYYAVGAEVITYLKGQGKKVFLDLKLHDIPNTAAQAIRALTRLGVDMINVHATGGVEMMKKAAEAVRDEAENCNIEPPRLIAVTILTSTSEAQWKEMGYKVDLGAHVIRLAKLAQRAGLDGVVASPMEAQTIRETCGEGFLIVTPGVRPIGAAINDQSRITTPAIALESGATHLVVGRPIRAAMNPRGAAENILKEMECIR